MWQDSSFRGHEFGAEEYASDAFSFSSTCLLLFEVLFLTPPKMFADYSQALGAVFTGVCLGVDGIGAGVIGVVCEFACAEV